MSTHVPSSPTSPPAPPRKAPAILLVVLVATMAAGPIFNYALSALSATVVADYHITEGQYGLIITLVFGIAGISSIFLGVLSDKIPVRIQVALISLFMIVAFLVSIVAPTYAALLTAACIAGPAQAFSNPATNRIIAHSVPRRQRGAWMGWKQSGVQFGLLFAGLTVPAVGDLAGWTGVALMCASLSGVLLVVGWLVITHLQRAGRTSRETIAHDDTDQAALPAAPSADGNSTGAQEATTASPANSADATRHHGDVQALASKPKLPLAVWLFAACSFLNAVGTQGVNAYASLFAVQTVHFPIQLAGTMLAIIGVAGILSRNVWGRLAGRFEQPATMIKVMSAGGVLALASLTLVVTTHSPVLLWVGVMLHAAFPLAANVVINSGVVAVAPSSRIGVASGMVGGGMNFGFAVGPVLVGFGLDTWTSYIPGWIVVAVTYVICFAVAAWLGRVQRRSA